VPPDLDGATASTGYCVLRPKPDRIDGNYLFHWVKTGAFVGEMTRRSTGANYPSVTDRVVRESIIPLPPLPEQRRIAAILNKADALRQKRREAIAKLDQLLQSVFLEMFGDPVSNEEDWDPCQLGDLIHAAKDGPHVSPEYSDAGIPFLSTRHIRAGKIQWTDLKYISKASAEIQWKKCRPEYGDILYTKGGTTGLAAEVDTHEPFAVWVHVAVLKTNHNVADPTWLTAMLNTSYCYAQSQRYTHGIANRDLGLGRMKKIKMYRPPQDLQKKFADFSRSLIVKRVFSYASATALDDLFQSIQQRAFTGQL
jgi:type I restriction enzyme S subunit